MGGARCKVQSLPIEEGVFGRAGPMPLSLEFLFQTHALMSKSALLIWLSAVSSLVHAGCVFLLRGPS